MRKLSSETPQVPGQGYQVTVRAFSLLLSHIALRDPCSRGFYTGARAMSFEISALKHRSHLSPCFNLCAYSEAQNP